MHRALFQNSADVERQRVLQRLHQSYEELFAHAFCINHVLPAQAEVAQLLQQRVVDVEDEPPGRPTGRNEQRVAPPP